jgi:hypothetical protein
MVWARAGESVGFIDNENMQTVAFGTVKTCHSESRELLENIPD